MTENINNSDAKINEEKEGSVEEEVISEKERNYAQKQRGLDGKNTVFYAFFVILSYFVSCDDILTLC